MTTEPGRMLSHYRLVDKIGEGGMGVVWKALDTKLHRHVALKLLPAELTTDPERRRRFLREARAAAAVTHPNIVTVHEIGEADGVVFLCMELVEGRTLRETIAGQAMPIPQALEIAAEMAEGLARAHQDGIVHRDFKPENVILTPDGHPKILDFGLAKLVEQRHPALRFELSRERTITAELTGEQAVLGTAAYMSPEQARGEAVDPRSDIFSFGIVLYEMATGRSPFKGNSRIETLAAILHEPAAPASRFNAEVPARLEEVLGKCLEKDPGARYQTSQDLVVDLRRLGRDLQTGVEPSYGGIRSPRVPIRRPWRVALLLGAAVVVVGGALVVLRPGGQAPGPAKPAHGRSEIAVLPFQNLSGEESQAYFAGGLHDELLTQLSKVAALKVISRTSVMVYQGTTKPLKQIADELGVGSIVEGSVQVLGDRLRVNVQLIDAAADEHLWAEHYDRTLDDAFAIQSEVAQQVVAAVGAALTDAEQGRLSAAPTPSAEAYQLYLKGKFFANKNVEAETWKGIRCFERALELDSLYAAAHAGLAIAAYSLTTYGHVSPDSAYPLAREHALEAVRLDPTSARAHEALGRLNLAEWHWEESARSYELAIEADPSSSMARDNYAFVLLFLGRTSEAAAQMRRVVELNPLSVIGHQNLGEVLYYARRYEESVVASLETIEMDPTFPQAHLFLGMAYAALGKVPEAVKALDRDREISGGEKPEIDSWLGVGYAFAGQTAQARRIYAEMLARRESRFMSPFSLACVCFALGDVDQGFAWLEEGYRLHDYRMAYLKVHPACDAVRNDPRYRDWITKMGLDA